MQLSPSNTKPRMKMLVTFFAIITCLAPSYDALRCYLGNRLQARYCPGKCAMAYLENGHGQQVLVYRGCQSSCKSTNLPLSRGMIIQKCCSTGLCNAGIGTSPVFFPRTLRSKSIKRSSSSSPVNSFHRNRKQWNPTWRPILGGLNEENQWGENWLSILITSALRNSGVGNPRRNASSVLRKPTPPKWWSNLWKGKKKSKPTPKPPPKKKNFLHKAKNWWNNLWKGKKKSKPTPKPPPKKNTSPNKVNNWWNRLWGNGKKRSKKPDPVELSTSKSKINNNISTSD